MAQNPNTRASRISLRDAERRGDLGRATAIAISLTEDGGEVDVMAFARRMTIRAAEALALARSQPVTERSVHAENAARFAVAGVDALAALSLVAEGATRQAAVETYVAALRLWKPIEWSGWLAARGWKIHSHVGYGFIRTLAWREWRIDHSGRVEPGTDAPPVPNSMSQGVS